MVAVPAVDRSAHRIDAQAARHRLGLHARMQPQRGIEGRLADAIGDELEADEKSPAANVANVRMLAESVRETPVQARTLSLHCVEQPVARDHLVHGERGGARHRVSDVRMSVLEEAAARGERIANRVGDEHGTDRLVAAAEAFRDRHQVGGDALLVDRVQRAGTAHPAHDLVEDQQDSVTIAEVANPSEVAGHRRHRAERRAGDGFGDERDDVVSAETRDLAVELVSKPHAVLLGRLAVAHAAIRVAGRNVRDVDQQRREWRAPPRISADGERAERIAVVALPPRDEMPPLRLSDLDEVLPRELQRGLDRLGTAGNEIDVPDAGRRMRDERFREPLGDVRREKARMRVRDRIQLRTHRGQDVRVPVTEA